MIILIIIIMVMCGSSFLCRGIGVIESGRRLLSQSQQMCSADVMWNRKIRARDYENILCRTAAKATKVATLVNEPSAAEVSDALLRFGCSTEEMKEFFDSLRNKPESCVSRPLSDSQLSIFKKMAPALKSSMYTTVALALLNKGVASQTGGVTWGVYPPNVFMSHKKVWGSNRPHGVISRSCLIPFFINRLPDHLQS